MSFPQSQQGCLAMEASLPRNIFASSQLPAHGIQIARLRRLSRTGRKRKQRQLKRQNTGLAKVEHHLCHLQLLEETF